VVGLAQWASPMCTMSLSFFLFNLIWIIQIMFKLSQICSNLNKFDKKMNSILLFEFKHILWNKNIKYFYFIINYGLII
jgi:hypothetical protein